MDDSCLLSTILIDEVELLMHARRAALAGEEPSDSTRAVNTVLVELDRLRRSPNALVHTISNVACAIDVAFADLRRLVGPPNHRAAYQILRICCEELLARGAVAPHPPLFALSELEVKTQYDDSDGSFLSLRLLRVARAAAAFGVSAPMLRRLSLLAAALHCPPATPAPPTLPFFVDALHAAVEQHIRDEADLEDAPRHQHPPASGH